MERTPNAPHSLTASTRLYQALLAVYPSEFRRAYGGPMLQTFRDCSRRTLHEQGNAGLVALWLRTMLDTAQTAIEEHAQRGVDMSKEKFIKLSGWAMMLGGLAILLSWLASSRPEYDRLNASSLPIDRYINIAEIPLMVMGLLLLSVGFIGLFMRYGKEIGSFGRLSLGMGALSGVVSASGAIGLFGDGSNLSWPMWFLGMVFQFLGLTFFGIANLRHRTMPRWNVLPFLAGVWVPLFALISLIIEQGTGRWVEWPEVVFFTIWLLGLIGLVGLGYVLQSDPHPTGMSAAAA